MFELDFVIFFVFLFAVLPCAVAGYFISVKQKRGLISGWNDEKYNDPEKAATVLGNILMLLSIIILIFSLLFSYEMLPKSSINYFVMVIIVLPVGALIYVHNKYGVK